MRDFVYTNKSIEECYGCKACEQICPKNAITMSENIPISTQVNAWIVDCANVFVLRKWRIYLYCFM